MSRITINPEICFSKSTIGDMRYPVEVILDLLSSGKSNEEILIDYDDLELDDINACLAFAAKMMRGKSIAQVRAV